MSFKRILFIVVLIALGVLEVFLYWNTHLYYLAKEKIKDNQKKIEVLERANQFYPYNELTYYELGKAYFDLGINSISQKELRNAYLQESIQNFIRSIKLNPASPLSHFNFAQSLLYMSYVSPSFDLDHYKEYKKAAFLTGHHSQIFYQVGKILFSRWPELSVEEKEFTLEILKKILGRRDPEKLKAMMHIWEMNVKDYDVMEKILPKDPNAYHLYAQFLGEKSLSYEPRQEMLAQAEFLEFEEAKEKHSMGQNEFHYFRLKKAFNHFRSSLNILKKINFYQDLTDQKLINPSEFDTFQKTIYLELLKCRIEDGASLEEVEGYLLTYLSLEDNLASIAELESYLKDRALISEKLYANLDNLKSLFFQIHLSFIQNRYREIMRVGRLLKESFIVIPEGQKEDYLKVLQFIGDSFLKVDYPYEAQEFYHKAIEIEPSNLENLLRIRGYYERMNEDANIRKIEEKIEKLLAPREIVSKYLLINKGERFSRSLIFDGREISLNLHFKKSWKRIAPLMTVIFNGQVVWEAYLEDRFVSIPLNTEVGENSLLITPVNIPVEFLKIRYQ